MSHKCGYAVYKFQRMYSRKINVSVCESCSCYRPTPIITDQTRVEAFSMYVYCTDFVIVQLYIRVMNLTKKKTNLEIKMNFFTTGTFSSCLWATQTSVGIFKPVFTLSIQIAPCTTYPAFYSAGFASNPA